MPRPDREVIPGLPHHVTHRGNRREKIFLETDDHRLYLRLLRKASERYGVRVYDYSLMPNHIHVIAVPERKESLSEAFQWADGKYAEIFNGLYDKAGHLWQGRFRSSPMDEDHLLNAVRYVLRNAVRAGLVDHAQDYPWSSAAARCGLRSDPLLTPDYPLKGVIRDWQAWLAGAEADEDLRKIRECTERGYAYASEQFVRDLEEKWGCRLSPSPYSRRRKVPEGSDPSGTCGKLFNFKNV